jgi:hypothetical protein
MPLSVVLLMPQKEGLQTAIDFTKYLLTLAGGAIAFGIQPNFFGSNSWLKAMALVSLVSLVISIFAGLMVYSRGCILLSEGKYKLEDDRLRFWGLLNMSTFGFSFFLLASSIAVKIIEA